MAFLVCWGVGCKKNVEEVQDSPNSVVRVRDQAGDFMLPAKLWDLLLPTDKVIDPKYQTENDEEMMGASVLFSELTVVLEERSPGVLTMPKIRLEFPKGGGQIDLSRWVSGKPGSYFVRFEAEGFADPSTLRVFFLSKAKKRKVDERIVGAGCKSYFDVTQFIASESAGKGFVVNTTRNFDVSTLGGHFLLSWQREGVYFVTQAKFVSSTQPHLFCNSGEEAS